MHTLFLRSLPVLLTLYWSTAIRLQLGATHVVMNVSSRPDEVLGTFQAPYALRCAVHCRRMESAAMDFEAGVCQCISKIKWMATELAFSTPFLYRPYRTGLTNVAFEKPTVAAKPFSTMVKEYGNDDVLCSNPSHHCCYSSDAHLPKIWWVVSLEATYRIYAVEAVLIGEGNYGLNVYFEVWIGDTDAPTGSFDGYHHLGTFHGPPPPGVTVNFYSERGMTGSYVGFLSEGHDAGITLCDVRVMAVPV